MSRVGTSGKERPPDLAALAPHAAALGELRARLPEHPRVASGKEIRAGLALVDRLPSPAGYEPAHQVSFSYDGSAEGTRDAGAGGAKASGSSKSVLDQQLGEMMGDAPMCDGCGHITVRNGACYKCLNCGSQSGCG